MPSIVLASLVCAQEESHYCTALPLPRPLACVRVRVCVCLILLFSALCCAVSPRSRVCACVCTLSALHPPPVAASPHHDAASSTPQTTARLLPESLSLRSRLHSPQHPPPPPPSTSLSPAGHRDTLTTLPVVDNHHLPSLSSLRPPRATDNHPFRAPSPTALPAFPTGSTRSAHTRLSTHVSDSSFYTTSRPFSRPCNIWHTSAAVERRKHHRASSRSFPTPAATEHSPIVWTLSHCLAQPASLLLPQSKTSSRHWLDLALRPSERPIYTTFRSLFPSRPDPRAFL